MQGLRCGLQRPRPRPRPLRYWLSNAGLGQWYMAGGALFNSLVLASVTVMTERRMLDNWPKARAALYGEYMRTTSACVPLPRFPWWGSQAEGRA
jgi:hypothetical protein